MRLPWFIAIGLLAACGGSRQKSCPEPAPQPTAASEPPAPAAYSGHGLASVSPEILARYPVRPLPDGVARHMAALADLFSPSPGVITPDGRRLVYSWRVTGVSQVWRIDGPGLFPTQLTGGADYTAVEAVLPDNKTIVVSRDRKGEENPGLYLLDMAGGRLRPIQHAKDVQTLFQDLSRDGRFVYYAANDVKPDAYAIYRYDVAAGRAERLLDQDGLWSVGDVADDGRLLLRKSTGSLTAEYHELDPKTKVLRPIIGQGETEEYVAAWGARPGEILVLTNKLGEFRRLYALTDGALEPITEEMAKDVDSFSIDKARARILCQVNDGGFFRLLALDARKRLPIALPELPDADHVYAGSTTPDGRFTTVGIDDGRHPLQSFVVDWSKKRATRWHWPSTPEIDTTGFARAALESYPARDGTPIPVLVRRPERCANALCPVIVEFHGGPEAQARPGFDWRAQAFVDAGFVFASPNVRGSDGYGKTWLHADDGRKRLAIITDIEDAARWARQRFAAGGAAPKVGIYGGSYGGYSALMGMTCFAGAYDAGVNVVGISNLVTFLENTAPYRRILRASEYGDPAADREALLELSPITHADKVEAPLLSLQGATDPRVPAGEAIQIHETLVQKGIPSDLMIFPDEGHGAKKRENQILMAGHAVAFFEQHLR